MKTSRFSFFGMFTKSKTGHIMLIGTWHARSKKLTVATQMQMRDLSKITFQNLFIFTRKSLPSLNTIFLLFSSPFLPISPYYPRLYPLRIYTIVYIPICINVRIYICIYFHFYFHQMNDKQVESSRTFSQHLVLPFFFPFLVLSSFS